MNKKLVLTGLTGLVLSVLGGCSLAPQYVRPDAPVADTYPIDGKEKTGRNAADIGWQDFFSDQRLQILIVAALENNRDLRGAALHIEEARAQYHIQSADLLPNLNGTAGASRARTPASLSTTGDAVTAGSYQVGFSLAAFELDFFGRVRSLNQAALAQYLATEEAHRAAKLSLVAAVAEAYLAERAFAEQQELAQQTLAGRQNAYQLDQQRFDAGALSAFDVRLSETSMLSARIALATLIRQRAQAGNALTLLVGKQMSGLPPPQPLSAQDIATDIPAGLPSDLLMYRPDIRAAEQRLKAANANIGAARAAFFPRITLTAGLGTASSALSGLFDAGSGTWSFAPQLTLPLFDAGRNSSNLDLAQVRKSEAVVDYEKTIQTAFREVADALVARDILNQQIDAQRAYVRAQEERLRLADLRYRNGVSNTLDLLDAQRDLFSAQQSLVQAQLLKLTNAIDLYRSLGGGLKQSTQMAENAGSGQ